MKLLSLVLLAFHLFFVSRAVAQSNLSTTILTAEFGDFVSQVLKDWNSPAGIAVAVVRQNGHGGWVVEQQGHGQAKADGTPVTPDTLFSIGSESKLFDIISTGLLISNASLEKPVTWTSKIADIIPEWELIDPIASAGSTIIDLMSHRTGMPRHDVSQGRNDTLLSVIERMKYLKPSTEFREDFQYNNIMYEVLSYLPTALLPSQPTLAEYVQEHIFDVLGMNSSTYSFPRANATGQLADSFGRVGNTTTNPLLPTEIYPMPFWLQLGGDAGNFASGPGGVISSVRDMTAWLKMLMSNGVDTSTNTTVVPASVLEEITSGITVWPYTEDYPEISSGTYGGARYSSSYRGHDLFEHGGDVQGFHSMVTWFPNDGAGIVVLMNDDLHYYRDIVRYRVMDLLFNLEPVDWNTRYQQLAVGTAAATAAYVSTRSPANATPPSVGFDNLPGTYDNPGYTSVELCAINPTSQTQTDSCKGLAETITSTFPQYVSDVPTFAFTWDRIAAQYVALSHFEGDVWNLTGWTGLPTDPHNASSLLWAYDAGFDGTVALTGVDANGTIGFGFLGGIWGAGSGVPDPAGSTPDQATEVWFAKVGTATTTTSQNLAAAVETSSPSSLKYGPAIVGLLAANLLILLLVTALAVLNFLRGRSARYMSVKDQEL
ncbi:Beta-lactamase domain-containing protein [Mycena chlorophos]|uniref:Beta-lactamase domain-containing protein n=1 Tax=Mycena chlorophos TaxID=658473 RepID=A0A8H6WKT8_MYCCL|nr:Beta-lactamase domain-containing protein [Mycena chlorophos]